MNRIDNLLRRARKAFSPAVFSAFCIIDHNCNTDKWIASPGFWDGIPGSGFISDAIPENWKSEYDTADEAAEAVDRLCASLNISNPERLVILIDDMGV